MQRMAVGIALFAALGIALNYVGLGNGRCNLPADDNASRRLVATKALHKTFTRNRLSERPEDYLHANPKCCNVWRRDFSLVDYIMWDTYSRPIYNASIRVAYIADGKLQTYDSMGLADRCGRMPDAYGVGNEVVARANLDLTVNRAVPLDVAVTPGELDPIALDDPRSDVTDYGPRPTDGLVEMPPRSD